MPSDPTNNDFKSNPVLSLIKVDFRSKIYPEGNTISRPVTFPLIGPYLTIYLHLYLLFLENINCIFIYINNI